MSVRVDREPCPYRIVDDAGGAFVFGLVGGSVWHLFGGIRNAPKGQRWVQAVSRVRARVPITGGSFAVWGVLFSCFDCTFTYLRKKEDPWNAIISGAATGGVLAARAGIKAAGRSALAGGVILAAIEGLNLLLMRVLMPKMEKQQLEAGIPIDTLEPPNDPLRPRSKLSFKKQKPLFQENPAPSPLFSSGGFDPFGSNSNSSNSSSNNSSGSSSGSAWDTPGFRPDTGFGSSDRSLASQSAEEEKKSSWKFW